MLVDGSGHDHPTMSLVCCRYVFNSVRLPGEYMDTPAVFPGHAYIVVIRWVNKSLWSPGN